MTETAFLLKKILTPLVLPPTGLLLSAMLGLLLLRRWPRTGRILSWGSVIVLLVLSLPSTALLLLDAAIMESGLNSSDARAAQAIVILGGGRKRAAEYEGSTVSAMTLERVQYGAKLAREVRLPILVTGGAVLESGPSEAELMATTLKQSFATDVAWTEERARDTHESAVFSAAILKARGIHTVLLVTHDIHQRRASMEFMAAGIKAAPAPVTMVSRGARPSVADRMPSAGALLLSSQALHEIIGIAMLALRTALAR